MNDCNSRSSVFSISSHESFLPRIHPASGQETIKIVKVSPGKQRRYSFIKSKSFKKLKEDDVEYKGIYKDGYMTQYERDKKEFAESRKHFLHGSFIGYSGAASAIPLRKDGGLRVGTIYLPPIQLIHPKDTRKPMLGPWC
jgi:hypothetical protein